MRSYTSRIAGICPAAARRIRRAAIAPAKVESEGSSSSLANSAGIADARPFLNSSVSTLVEGRPEGFPLRPGANRVAFPAWTMSGLPRGCPGIFVL